MVATDLSPPVSHNLSFRDQQMINESGRPTARLAGWLDRNLREILGRNRKTRQAESSPRNFSEIQRVLLVGELPRKHYLAGFDYIIQTVRSLGIGVDENKKYQDVLRILVSDQRRDKILEQINSALATSLKTSNQDIKLTESIAVIFGVTDGLFTKNRVRNLAGQFKGVSFDDSYGHVPDLLRDDKDFKRSFKTLGPGGKDVMEYFSTDEMPNDKINLALSTFELVWNTMRSSADIKHCRILFTNATFGQPVVRSAAIMDTQPCIVLELNQNDLQSVVAHEAVHACMGAESGHPYSKDFAEGCAMRLGKAFVPDGSINLPNPEILDKLRQARQTELLPKSSTTMIRNAQAKGIDIGEFVKDNAQYVFGYFFMDALLKSPTYDVKRQEAVNRGERTYFVLNHINSIFNDLGRSHGGSLKNSEMIRVGLLRSGFSNQDIDEILRSTNDAIKNSQ